MRPIKFKGKRIDNGEWVYGYLLNSFEGTHIIESDYFKPSNDEHPWLTDVDGKTIGQFTGLLDKNGKEVYVGHLLSIGTSDFGNTRDGNDKVVEYEVRVEGCEFFLYRNDIGLRWGRLGRVEEMGWECEIIGNIHD